MKLAIMQPYFFPYLGYFQLVSAVDCFVFYDDVGFIKQGWINRNRVLVNGRGQLISVPVSPRGVSPPICETPIDVGHFPRWKAKTLRLLRESYSAAPCRDRVLALVAQTLRDAPTDIGCVARRSVELTCQYLGIGCRFLVSSKDLHPRSGRGVERVLAICGELGASEYVNLPGGRALYTERPFLDRGIRLRFLEPRLEPYPQGVTGFVPSLSILDVLMRVSPESVNAMASAGNLC
jgi:hypothetical protein